MLYLHLIDQGIVVGFAHLARKPCHFQALFLEVHESLHLRLLLVVGLLTGKGSFLGFFFIHLGLFLCRVLGFLGFGFPCGLVVFEILFDDGLPVLVIFLGDFGLFLVYLVPTQRHVVFNRFHLAVIDVLKLGKLLTQC